MSILRKHGWIPTVLKYVLSLTMLGLAFYGRRDLAYLWAGLAELLFVFGFFNHMKLRFPKVEIIHELVLFFFDVWCGVLFFGSSYVTLVMVENLVSIVDLIGMIVPYLGLLAIVLILCFYPGEAIHTKWKLEKIAPLLLFLDLLLCQAAVTPLTPLAGMLHLGKEYQEHLAFVNAKESYASREEALAALDEAKEALRELNRQSDADEPFAQEQSIASQSTTAASSEEASQNLAFGMQTQEEASQTTTAATKPQISADTNIILIFMEGLSRNVIFDERDIMPNLNAFSRDTINYVNYYNQTFATYRGLQGQLYSGETLNDQEQNHLTSVLDVLEEAGYETTLINVEPANQTFTKYLNELGFDQVISDGSGAEGMVGSLSDEQAYEKILETASQYQAEGKKYFLTCYTFGSHASFDSTGQKYGDGSDAVLNKFYNADYYFGSFYQEFMESGLADNTMLIFTSDHCSYGDFTYASAFPNHETVCTECDEIPLFIYYQGQTDTVNADGRNTLDLSPTILDLLGLSSPETFLGASLYEPKGSSAMDTYFWDASYLKTTGNDEVENVDSEKEEKIRELLGAYFALKSFES